MICLICGLKFDRKRSISTHVRSHNLTIKEYKKKFNLLCYCLKCRKEIHCESLTKYCNLCRDRTGVNNPFYKKKHTKEAIDILKIKCKEATQILWKNEKYRDKVIKGISKPRNLNFKIEQSKRIKKWFDENPEQKKIRSKCMKKSWIEGLIVKNGYSSNTSKMEKELYKELKRINEFFEEKVTLKINTRWFFPDIIDQKRKLIIEFFGDYWHQNPSIFSENSSFLFGLTSKDVWASDDERIKTLETQGYKIIIIWEKEFKENKTLVLNTIRNFLP